MVKSPVKGSIRVFKSDVFYETDKVKRIVVSDGISEAKIIPSCLTKELQAIFDRHQVAYPPTEVESRRLIQRIDGLDFEEIETVDNEHLRIKYNGTSKRNVKEKLMKAIKWLESHNVSYGESDGKAVCIFKCITPEQLELEDF